MESRASSPGTDAAGLMMVVAMGALMAVVAPVGLIMKDVSRVARILEILTALIMDKIADGAVMPIDTTVIAFRFATARRIESSS